ncbi:GDSL-type esterase/lipase family protein [Fodinisporobacter ferrooxydans]|uniref:GDSL-type esterase/lipase family protein n=1 Tax=Fodinisporobacter ferrooxydans TaxID=2901836 RepID=A0ABY4CHM1_9BACL|nr:GDSL-type esterase/lipase family protein [Alicyclobacillaceae bacterium MYW30-H2]
MKGRDLKWFGIGCLAVCCTVLLAAGTGLALSRSALPHRSALTTQPKQLQKQVQTSRTILHGPIRIFAMGDSLSRGYGDETGLGYIGDLQQALEKKGLQTTVDNIAVDGFVSDQLVHQIKDPAIQKQVAAAKIITFSIGGNDLVRNVANFTIPTIEQTKASEEHYLKNLNTILQTVRANNSQAPILMVGLYNPFLQLQGGAAGTAVVEDWNGRTSTLLRSYTNTYLVPTLDIFAANGDKFLYADHFHPNAAGYQAIAARMLQDLSSLLPS